MRKLFYFILMVMVGIGLSLSNSKAEEARTIPFLHGVAKDTNTVIVAHGGTLHLVTGYAEDANCEYSIHDASDKFGTGSTNQGTIANTLVEGGEATDQDSITTIDFGDDGMPFTYGLVVMTTTCNIAVAYR